MAVIKPLLVAAGILFVLMGLLWIGQGMGIVRWPASSFMIDVSGWAMRGAVLAVVGAVMIWLGRRLGR